MGRGGERAPTALGPGAVVHISWLSCLAVALPLTLALTWLLTVRWAEFWGVPTYFAAWYRYADGSIFDDSALTFASDYALTAWCGWLGSATR